jgi:hypothetical protein
MRNACDYLIVSAAMLLTACAGVPVNYVPPSATVERAFVTFEYRGGYAFPVSTAQILAYEEGSLECKLRPGGNRLFARGRGNPIVADVNLEGTWLAAGKPLFLVAQGITSVKHMCAAFGTFTPRAGVSYAMVVEHQSPYEGYRDTCILHVLEAGDPQKRSADYVPLDCGSRK